MLYWLYNNSAFLILIWILYITLRDYSHHINRIMFINKLEVKDMEKIQNNSVFKNVPFKWTPNILKETKYNYINEIISEAQYVLILRIAIAEAIIILRIAHIFPWCWL